MAVKHSVVGDRRILVAENRVHLFLSPGRSSSFIKPLTQEKSLLISPWDRISIPTDLALFGRRIRLEWLDTGESEAGSGEGRRRDRTWQRRREKESQKRRAVDLFLLPFGSETGVDLLAARPTNYRRVECQCMAVCTLMKRSSADSSVRTSSWRAEPFINFERKKKHVWEKKSLALISLWLRDDSSTGDDDYDGLDWRDDTRVHGFLLMGLQKHCLNFGTILFVYQPAWVSWEFRTILFVSAGTTSGDPDLFCVDLAKWQSAMS